MRKFAIYFALILLCLAIIPTVVLATTTEQEICLLATANEKVPKAQCVIFERNCLIAIQTEKFTNKSEYCDFVDSLEKQIKEKYQLDNVFVTRSPRAMCAIEKLNGLSEKERQEKIQEIFDNLGKKPMPLPFFKTPLDR